MKDAETGSKTKSRRWPRRLGRVAAALALGWLLFHLGCVGRPQSFDDALAPAEPRAVPERAESWPIRIANYNVWAIPIFSDDIDERVAKMPAAILEYEPDVLALQEVWTGGVREDLAEGFGPGYAAARCDSGGLMVISRFPIRSERFTPFPFCFDTPITEWPAKKGVMEVVVETPAGPVRIVTTHLALDFGEDNARTRQLRFLLDLLDERRDLPLIVAADLNTPPVMGGVLFADYEMVIDRGYTDLKPPVKRGFEWDPGQPTRQHWPRVAGGRGFYPDHMLIRENGIARLIPGAFRMALDTPETALSDHNLLLADVEIRAVRE